MAPKLPQQFGPYTLQELIARGGMAEIYRATMPGIGGFEKTVAIKKILPHLAENDEFITMLIDEARIIVSINHANIAQVYDLGEIAEDYYIAMEYIHGIDLSSIAKDLKESGRTVPVEHAVFMASGIAAGLHVAHNKCDDSGRPLNIVHRDVSPHNILISFAGDVKIIDFGVAKARGKEAHTQLGVIKGKLLYMAPEQAMAKDIDGRADLFAMGLILYRMLTNHLPFEGDNEFQIYNNILSKEITPPRELNPDIPEEVNQIVMMLLQRDPSKRYQDGYSAKVDLDRALQNIAPGYSISRLSRWVEDNFTHLAQKRRKRKGVDSGQNDFAPSTPSRNQVGTGEMMNGEVPRDEDAEDTVNLSMKGPEAQAMLAEAAQRRRHQQQVAATGPMQRQPQHHGPSPQASQSNQWGQPGNGSGQFPQQGNGSGQFPQRNNASGQFPQQNNPSGQFPSGQFPSGQSPSGQFPQQSSQNNAQPNPSGQFPEADSRPSGSSKFPIPDGEEPQAKGGGVPMAPLAGIFLLLLVILGMLGYQFFAADADGPAAEAVTAPPSDGKQGAEPGDNAMLEVEPVEVPVVAEAGEPDAGAEELVEDIAVVSLSVKSTPEGATVTVDGAELGQTPFEGELPKGEDTVTLLVEKDGYAPQEVRITPFSSIRKSLQLEAEPGTEVPKEEVKEDPAPPPTQKRVRRKRPPKKVEKKREEPAVPLLLDDGPAPKKKPKDEEDLIDPFDI